MPDDEEASKRRQIRGRLLGQIGIRIDLKRWAKLIYYLEKIGYSIPDL